MSYTPLALIDRCSFFFDRPHIMDSHKNTSPFIRQESDEPITTTTTITNSNNNDMVDIELADSKDELESAEKERAKIIKKLIIQLVVFVLFFCLLYFGGWTFIESCSATVDLFTNDCEAKGGYIEGHNATGSHKSVCKGIGKARRG